MDTNSIIFITIMIAIGVTALMAFLIYLIPATVARRNRPTASRGDSPPLRPLSFVVSGVLALLVVSLAVGLAIWLLAANADFFLLKLEGGTGAVVFFVIMLLIGAAGLVGFLIYAVVRSSGRRKGTPELFSRGSTDPAQPLAPSENAEPPAPVETPAGVRLLGLLVLIFGFMILSWVFLPRELQYRLMLALIYPASFAVALVMLFDKATRAWGYKSAGAGLREWIFCDLFVFLLMLAYLNLFLSHAEDRYGSLFWDVLGLIFFFFAFWIVDRKATRYRFLAGYGYLIALPLLLLIWTAVQDVPPTLGYDQTPPVVVAADTDDDSAGEAAGSRSYEEEEAPDISWWVTMWPLFFLALIFFVLEIIQLLAIGEGENHTVGSIKEFVFAALYAAALLIAA